MVQGKKQQPVLFVWEQLPQKNSLALEYRTMLEVIVEEERVYMYQDIFYQWYYIFGKVQWILRKCNIYYSMDMNS